MTEIMPKPSLETITTNLGDSRVAKMWVWLDAECRRAKNPKRGEMFAAIRNELSRFSQVERTLYQAHNTINAISEAINNYWKQ